MRSLPAVALLLITATALTAATAGKPPVEHAAMTALEKSLDERIVHASAAEPLDLMGNTRGIYLAGYGTVFTTQVNLIISPTLSPFRQQFTKQEVGRIHARKLERLPMVRQKMREMLLSTAAALSAVPPGEQIVVGVSLFYFSWEDTSGLPTQIIMQGERQKLLSRTVAESAIHTEEY